MGMSEIRVLLVDDQRLVREGLRVLLDLTPDIRVVGEAGDGSEVVDQVALTRPDVVLMDVRMPELDGVAATRLLQNEHPEVKVIILTTFDDDEYVFEGLRSGAAGYLLKDAPSEQLAEAIRAVARGEVFIQPSVTGKVVAEFARLSERDHRRQVQPLIEPLSAREIEVLALLAEGLSNREIGERLCIAAGTAKNHISSILSKLDVRDRTQAVLRAQDLGLL